MRVADGDGPVRHFECDWTEPSMLIVGSEANGPCSLAKERADQIVSIPLEADSAESLNAAVAGAVILFEAQRQRLMNENKE